MAFPTGCAPTVRKQKLRSEIPWLEFDFVELSKAPIGLAVQLNQVFGANGRGVEREGVTGSSSAFDSGPCR